MYLCEIVVCQNISPGGDHWSVSCREKPRSYKPSASVTALIHLILLFKGKQRVAASVMQAGVSSEAFHVFWGQQKRVFPDEQRRCAYALEKAGCVSVPSCSWAEWGAASGSCGEGWPPSCCLPKGARGPGRADAAAPLLYWSETPPLQRRSPAWEDGEAESVAAHII